MKPDIFIHSAKRLNTKLTVTIKKLKQLLKSIKTALISVIETVYFYTSEIKFKVKMIKVNSRNN